MRAFAPSRGCESRTQESPRNPEDSQKQSRPADLFNTTAVPRHSAAVDVCRILECSSSARRRSAGCLLIAQHHTTGEESQTYQLGLDSRWSATPISHPNPTGRSRHRVMPVRTANVCKSPPHPNCPSHEQSCLTCHQESNARWSHRQSRQPLGPSTPARQRRRRRHRHKKGHQQQTMTMTISSPSPSTKLQPSIPQSSNRSTRVLVGVQTLDESARGGARGSCRRQQRQFSHTAHSVTNSI